MKKENQSFSWQQHDYLNENCSKNEFHMYLGHRLFSKIKKKCHEELSILQGKKSKSKDKFLKNKKLSASMPNMCVCMCVCVLYVCCMYVVVCKQNPLNK